MNKLSKQQRENIITFIGCILNQQIHWLNQQEWDSIALGAMSISGLILLLKGEIDIEEFIKEFTQSPHERELFEIIFSEIEFQVP